MQHEKRASNGNIVGNTSNRKTDERYINPKIEAELLDFKKEIEEKFASSDLKTFKFPLKKQVTHTKLPNPNMRSTRYASNDVVMNEVEQNLTGDILCVPYNDNGTLGAVIFNNQGKSQVKININDLFENRDVASKPIFGFNQPMVTACFTANDEIYFSMFHRQTMT